MRNLILQSASDSTMSKFSGRKCIILTAEEANQVRGEASPGYEIMPRQTEDGRYILGTQILEDPAYAKHIPFLMTLPWGRISIRQTGEFTETVKIYDDSIFFPDHSPRTYIPNGAAYASPSFPEAGDWNECALYETVGRALSAWEMFERSFSFLFEALLSPTLFGLPAQRAYGAIVTFKGRSEMVVAAGEAYFMGNPDEELQKKFRRLITDSGELSKRRNEIAHGVVGPYDSPAGHQRGLALMPATYATNKHTLRTDINPNIAWAAIMTKPKYAYCSAEIIYFTECFSKITKPTYDLSSALYRVFDVVPPAMDEPNLD